jgi:hypothetical protein
MDIIDGQDEEGREKKKKKKAPKLSQKRLV